MTNTKKAPVVTSNAGPKESFTPEPVKEISGNIFHNAHGEEAPGGYGEPDNFFCNNCVAIRWTQDAHDGKSSIKISNRKASWAGINYALGMKISDGSTNVFNGWVKVLKWGNHKVQMTARIESGFKPQYEPVLSKIVQGYKWTKLEANIELSGGAVTLYIEGFEKSDYLIDQFSLVKIGGGSTNAAPTKSPVTYSPDPGDQKLRDPGFEISPNVGAGWSCNGCTGVPVTDDVLQPGSEIKFKFSR